MLFVKFTTMASLIGCAIAKPIADPIPDSKIVKRGEGVHLVNCGNTLSAVVYCSNDSNCNHTPTSSNICVMHNAEGGPIQWEGVPGHCTFSTGVEFAWNIEADAQSENNYVLVGLGSNAIHNFDIYKDDKHVMFTYQNQQCKSIYYCLDA